MQETTLTSISTALQRAKEIALAASNGTATDADRKAYASELGQIQQQVLGLMNSKDAAGNYLFSGSKTDTAPYTQNADGTYTYNGDQTQINLGIGDGMIGSHQHHRLGCVPADHQHQPHPDHHDRSGGG